MRHALVLRPEPGATRTIERLAAVGVPATALPLFEVRPRAWSAPDPARFDALLLTSANAVRHAGDGLARVAHLPVVAVGAATAAAARDAGLRVTMVGEADAAAVVRQVAGRRLLHLAGRDHVVLPGVEAIAVYASDARALPDGALDRALAAAPGTIALLHSVRAAARFAALFGTRDRARVGIAALAPAVLAAAGAGWRRTLVAARPSDVALVAAVADARD